MGLVVAIDPHSAINALPPREERRTAQYRIHDQALNMIIDEQLINARFTYGIIPLNQIAEGSLWAEGECFHAPRLLPESGKLTAVGCGVATIGNTLEHRVTSLFAQKKASLALALDKIGNQILFEVDRRLFEHIFATTQKTQLSMAGELRPGDPGLDLCHQPALLRLADSKSIGVNCNQGNTLTPLKSTSMIFGIGEDLPTAKWSRCDECRFNTNCSRTKSAKTH